MVMEILTFVGNFQITSCIVLVKAWKTEYRKRNDIFTIDAMKKLPFVIISHLKKEIFGKFP
jgi:hypothetical protein